MNFLNPGCSFTTSQVGETSHNLDQLTVLTILKDAEMNVLLDAYSLPRRGGPATKKEIFRIFLGVPKVTY